MNSRMEKYYTDNDEIKKRIIRNKELYRKIYEEAEYTNIEGITNIEKSNEIDITKIKELLFKNKKEEKELPKSIEEENFENEINEEEKNYDIRDVLIKAKNEREDKDDKYRSLSNTQYNILKNLKIDETINNRENLSEEEVLKEMINTINTTSVLNQLGDKELSLKMFEELKASENTIAMEKQELESIKTEEEKLDKSFYTSSLNFKEEDFEELKEINNTLKKNNVLIRILLIILCLIAVATIIWFVVNNMGL